MSILRSISLWLTYAHNRLTKWHLQGVQKFHEFAKLELVETPQSPISLKSSIHEVSEYTWVKQSDKRHPLGSDGRSKIWPPANARSLTYCKLCYFKLSIHYCINLQTPIFFSFPIVPNGVQQQGICVINRHLHQKSSDVVMSAYSSGFQSSVDLFQPWRTCWEKIDTDAPLKSWFFHGYLCRIHVLLNVKNSASLSIFPSLWL